MLYNELSMFDLIPFIKAIGVLGVGGVVFAESGLLIGFFLPGDSLLFTAGFLASQGFLNIIFLVITTFVAAVVGDSVGYTIGRKAGPKIFAKEESFWFNPKQIERAHIFFEKHGAKAIIFARFLPIVRTFVPVIAGVGNMKYRTFFLNNIIGALLWAVGVALAGFFLGRSVPNAEHYLLPIILFIIAASFLPTIIHVLRDKEEREYILRVIRKIRNKFSI